MKKPATGSKQTHVSSESAFLDQVSHELRTPLNAILGMAHLALHEDVPATVREYLAAIEAAALQLADVANDISDFSDLTCGQFELSTDPVHVRDAIEGIVRSLSSISAEYKTTIGYEVDDSVPNWLIGDAARVRQLIGNIVRYALANINSSALWIRMTAINRGKECDGRVVVHLSITDSDDAAAADGIHRVSDAVQCNDAAELGIARKLVAAMGGTIVCHLPSAGGIGVRLSLPFETCDTPHPTTAPPHSQPLNILLAEDVPANQTIVRRLLEKDGHAVTVACNGRKAIEEFRRADFDAILMDIQMPVLDGYASTAEIRRIEKSQSTRTPILGMTAHASQQVRDKCLEAGMDAYLQKPIDITKLARVLYRIATAAPADEQNARFANERGPRAPIKDSSTALLDFDAALGRLHGDLDLFKEFVEVFDEDCPKLFEEIRTSHENQHAEQIGRAAHKLQGLAANLGAESLRRITLDLEKCCGSMDTATIQHLINHLEHEIVQLSSQLHRFR